MSEAFVQMGDDQLGRLSLIEAMRANTDAVQRLARADEGKDKKLDEITKSLAKIDTRLALLENNSIKGQVETHRRELEEHETRIRALEDERSQRKGAMGLVEWASRNWPAIIGYGGLAALVASKGGWL